MKIEGRSEAKPEVETELKEEDAGEDRSDNDADIVEEDTGEEPAVSTDQYKSFKNITEVLTNFKIKVKGDEYVCFNDGALSQLINL